MGDSLNYNLPEVGKAHFPEIDFLKSVAIISVIFVHTVPYDMHVKVLSPFHLNQQVPIFFILMGITSCFYFKKLQSNRIAIFSKTYFLNRFERIIVPFLFVFAISLWWGIHHNKCDIGFMTAIGKLPVSGPGNYFITDLLQFILIAPFLYKMKSKSPRLMLATSFTLDFIFQLVSPFITVFDKYPYLYSGCILRYLSAIALGYYVGDEYMQTNRIVLWSNRNRFILLWLPISMVYLSVSIFMRQPFPYFKESWGHQNIISNAYALVLVIMLVNNYHLFGSNIIARGMVVIGKGSYHIFLAQILFFSFKLSFERYVNKSNLVTGLLLALLGNLVVTILCGLLFWQGEKYLKKLFIHLRQSGGT